MHSILWCIPYWSAFLMTRFFFARLKTVFVGFLTCLSAPFPPSFSPSPFLSLPPSPSLPLPFPLLPTHTNRYLSTCSILTSLSLGSRRLGPTAISNLAPVFPKLLTLTHLCLSGNEMGAQGATSLAAALTGSNLSLLTSLDISNNQCGLAGGRAFAETLDGMVSLSHLDISRNGKWAELPDGVEFLPALESLVISDNDISWLPVKDLCALTELKSIVCHGNSRLFCPPPLIAAGGGEEVVAYLKRAVRLGEANKEIEVQVVGPPESGKTHLIDALCSEWAKGDKSSIPEGEDEPTVGIRVRKYRPPRSGGMSWRLRDFGGGKLYDQTHEFFLAKKAMTVLVWACVPLAERDRQQTGDELCTAVCDWLDNIHCSSPGACIILVATHIDCAPPEDVDLECDWVKAAVCAKVEKLHAGSKEAQNLSIWNDGGSICVDSVGGPGISMLRQEMVQMCADLPWYAEYVPRPYLSLRDYLQRTGQKGKPTLDWIE